MADEAPLDDNVESLRATLAVRNRQINAVHQISSVVSSSLDLDDRLRAIMKTSMEAVEAAAGTIYLYRPADNKLVFSLVVGDKSKELTGRAMDATVGVAGAVFQEGKSRITADARATGEHNRVIGESVGFQTESIVTVPLKYQDGRPVGVMQVLNKRHGQFDQNDLGVLEIVSAVAASAIENAQLHREAQLSAVAHALGDLSHDIKNKVAPISGWVDTLGPMFDEYFQATDGVLPVIAPEPADRLREAAADLRMLYPEGFHVISEQVLEVQEFTRLIADTVKGIVTEPQLEPHDLRALVERQLESLELNARQHGVTLNREYGDVPDCKFDRFSMERAVYNLVNNAIPETPMGGAVTLRTRWEGEGIFPAGGYVLVEVQDTGRGMPPEVLERILRGDAKSTKPGGTGLGTRIVYNAVAAHHGIFEGESQPGSGTTFRLKIPYLKA